MHVWTETSTQSTLCSSLLATTRLGHKWLAGSNNLAFSVTILSLSVCHLHSNQKYVSKDRTYRNEASYRGCLALPSFQILGHKCSQRDKYSSLFARSINDEEKSFQTLTPGGSCRDDRLSWANTFVLNKSSIKWFWKKTWRFFKTT
jgi:hypothetical protein